MAKRNYGKKSYHRNYRLRPVRTTPDLALLTLATKTVLDGAMHPVADGAFRIISSVMNWAIVNQAAGDGPITVGYCHSDYTVAEIKEFLEANASISMGDKIAQEQAGRLIRIVGTMPNISAGVNTLNDGKPIKTRLNWLITIGDTLNFFAYNDGAALLSTGSILSVTGTMWIKDST